MSSDAGNRGKENVREPGVIKNNGLKGTRRPTCRQSSNYRRKGVKSKHDFNSLGAPSVSTKKEDYGGTKGRGGKSLPTL